MSTDQQHSNSVANLVRTSLKQLESLAPGRSVEVRVVPWGAVSCITGVKHKRGTPPNVIETDANTWLDLVDGKISLHDALRCGLVEASGTRALEVEKYLPFNRLVKSAL